MLGLKLNHVSKRGHWRYPLLWTEITYFIDNKYIRRPKDHIALIGGNFGTWNLGWGTRTQYSNTEFLVLVLLSAKVTVLLFVQVQVLVLA